MQQNNNPTRPFRYEEKSVEDDFELVNVVSRTNRKSLPPSTNNTANNGVATNLPGQSNYQTTPQQPLHQYNGILSTATNRLSLALTSPVMVDGNSENRNEEVSSSLSVNNRRSIELSATAVEYNFRPDFEKEYIKRTEELMKKEEEEEKTRKAKFIAMLEQLNSTTPKGNNSTINNIISNNNNNSKEVIAPNNFMNQSQSSFPSLTQSINQLVNIPFSSPSETTVNNSNRTTPSPLFNSNGTNSIINSINTTNGSSNYNPSPSATLNNQTSSNNSNNYGASSFSPPPARVDSYQVQPTYTAIPTMNQNPLLGFSTDEEVECYYNVLEVYTYPGFSSELARFATEAYRGDQLKVFDYCDKYRQLAEMHFSDKDIKEVLLLTDRNFEQSLDMLVNQKSQFPSSTSYQSPPQMNKYTTITLRIPNDGKTYALPCSLGKFPIKRVEDYASTVPAHWLEHGGVFIPLYQSEAMWIQFEYSNSFNNIPEYQSDVSYKNFPLAAQMGVGLINALTGDQWDESDFGKNKKQNYMVLPTQQWLDGIACDEKTVKQFVAMPLGSGKTVEEQLTGNADYGGVQFRIYQARKDALSHLPLERIGKTIGGGNLKVYVKTLTGKSLTIYTDENDSVEDLKKAIYEVDGTHPNQQRLIHAGKLLEDARTLKDYKVKQEDVIHLVLRLRGGGGSERDSRMEMGLGVGGRIEQKIYKDPFGVSFWDLTASGKCFVHIVNSEMWKKITGEECPPTPISKTTYKDHNYPWFTLYDEGIETCQVSDKLSNLTSVDEKHVSSGNFYAKKL